MAEPQAYEPEKLTSGVTWKRKKTISDYLARECEQDDPETPAWVVVRGWISCGTSAPATLPLLRRLEGAMVLLRGERRRSIHTGICHHDRRRFCMIAKLTSHTPPAPRLRLLLVGGVSFGFSFQFFSSLTAVFAEEVCGFGFVKNIGSI